MQGRRGVLIYIALDVMQGRRGDLIYIALGIDARQKKWSYLYCFRE